MESRPTFELLAEWASVMRELKRRGVIRTNNNPVGDIAEAIVAAHVGGQRGSFSQRGWDVLTPEGERIQVKAMRQTGRRRNLSPIRDSDYDSVIVVVFDEDFQITEGLKVSREVVEDLFDHRAYVNGRIIVLTQALRADPRVERIDLSETAAPLST